MMKPLVAALFACLALPASAAAQGGSPQPATSAAQEAGVDYSRPASWLCRPDQLEACDVDLTTTVVAADGRLARETASVARDAPIDCFYVYPTVSTDPTPNSDMSPDPAERNVIRQQFARFATVCRPYAPMYRQVTLAGLRTAMSGGARARLDRGVGYDDVRAAWRYYLDHDNQGRGVVLIGHSQGAMVLTELIRQEIDGKPVQKQLISALLLGTTVAVAKGKDAGGAFEHLPLCRAPEQTGCVLTFASYRSTIPPPANTLFGRVAEPGLEAACTNPAALGGGRGELRAYLAADGQTITGKQPAGAWVAGGPAVDTPWVSVPGLLTARCAINEHAAFLEVTVNAVPADPRTDEIAGDIGPPGKPQPNWGLHLIDANLAMGNLVDLVQQQGRAYAAKRR